MPSLKAKRLSWADPSPRLYAEWVKRARAIGLDVGEFAETIRSALKHAAACRCAETAKQVVTSPVAPAAPAANPLKSLREAAGLSQLAAAQRLGCTRGALSTAENRASVSEKLLDRARKAYGKGAAK